ncbi:MAG TPA: NAD(P)/FAD-dependent oxidoreductase, partial [Polyangiales bacterium]|nr:NAD(P)/FAD-dependent oxidoreductase [Polyangiales bacterium]
MSTPDRIDVAIVGGGPVGLLLGCLLVQRGIDARVYERRRLRSKHSRAVGVHPPGLDCLAAVGLATELMQHAVTVRHAFAFDERRTLGTIDFSSLPGPFQFVLTVPQTHTEALLERKLQSLHDRAYAAGAQIDGCHLGASSTLFMHHDDEQPRSVRARFVIGCEGKHSLVRESAQIPFEGAPYSAHFMMADTRDETPFGEAAAVFLTRDGLVESFPMPGKMRRWVVALGRRGHTPDLSMIERLVRQRTGQCASPGSATMVSSFRAEHFLADTFVQERMVLAGDAAHVLSPIGGQGMNLGWLDAMMLGELLPRMLANPALETRLLGSYDNERRTAARRAIRRAEAFMTVAAERQHTHGLAELTVRALLSDPLKA